MTAWTGLLPAVLLFLFLLAGPGIAILWGSLRFSLPAAIMFSLPVGAAVATVGTITFPLIGLDWNLWTFLVLAAVVSAACVAWRVFGPRRGPLNPVVQRIGWSHVGWGALGAGVFAVAYGASVLPAMGSLDALPTVGDALFHMHGAAIIGSGGNAAPFGPFPEMYPQYASAPYYPTLWHALVVPLTDFLPVIDATNAAAVATGLVAWPWALASLAAALRTGGPLKVLFAPLLALPFVLMPAIEVFAFAVYPLALSIVLLITTLGLVAVVAESPRWGTGLALALALVGTGGAHPTSALLAVAALGMWGLVLVFRAAVRMSAEGHVFRGVALAVGTVLVLAAGAVAITRVGLVQQMNMRPTEWVPYRRAIGNLIMGPTFMQLTSLFPALVGLLAVAGAVLSVRRIGNVVLACLAVLLVAMYIAAAGPESFWRIFTSPWWKDASRFAIVLSALMVSFAALPLARACRWLQDRLPGPRGLAGLVVALLALGLGIMDPLGSGNVKTRFIEDSYKRSDETPVGITVDELELLQEVGEFLPPGTVVVGDPDSGASWVGLFSDATQFQFMRFPVGEEQKFLAGHFSDILEDPRVCEIIVDNQITAFIRSDSPSEEFAGWYSGYNDVDTTEGFELIHQVGGASLYEITACDQ